jgi:hypothetical protein
MDRILPCLAFVILPSSLTYGCTVQPGLANAPQLGGTTIADPRVHDVITNGPDSRPAPTRSSVRAPPLEPLRLPSNPGVQQKGDPMNYPSQALVHHLFASHLQIDDASIKNTHSFDELGLDPLDLVLVVLRLEDFDRGNGVVALVDFWRQSELAGPAKCP